jgi:hypothetical protein
LINGWTCNKHKKSSSSPFRVVCRPHHGHQWGFEPSNGQFLSPVYTVRSTRFAGQGSGKEDPPPAMARPARKPGKAVRFYYGDCRCAWPSMHPRPAARERVNCAPFRIGASGTSTPQCLTALVSTPRSPGQLHRLLDDPQKQPLAATSVGGPPSDQPPNPESCR